MNPTVLALEAASSGSVPQSRVWLQGEICCPKSWDYMYPLQVFIENMHAIDINSK